jgi:predicted nucleic acid-binding protein
MRVVLDASVAVSWCLPDETSPQSEMLKAQLVAAEIDVPELWRVEVRNALLMAERRKRISAEAVEAFMGKLPVLGVREHPLGDLHEAMTLARKHSLTLYDALYLELSIRLSARLATFDEKLANAAKNEKLDLLP